MWRDRVTFLTGKLGIKSSLVMADNAPMGKGDLVPRIITDFSVEMNRDIGDRWEKAASVNLSETGVCVQIARPPEVGQVVQLRITIYMQTTPMVLRAKAVWIRSDPENHAHYCGLGFVDPDPEQVELIRFYMAASTQILMEFLSEFPLFKDFTLEDCRNLTRIATRRELARREVLYYEGSDDRDLQGLFIVQKGLLAIFKGKRHNPEHQIAVVSPGQVFGETTLVMEQPHSASVKAVNQSTLIQINKQGFNYLKQDNPQLALKFMEMIARALAVRLGRTTKRLFSPIRLHC